MRKLKASEVAAQRAMMLAEQEGHCMLCCERIAEGEDVLDHCHTTGHVRAVLHRGCNVMLGHIENNRARHMMKGGRLFRFLRGVENYINADHRHKPIHPTHKTEDEKRALRNKRARKARAAKKGTE